MRIHVSGCASFAAVDAICAAQIVVSAKAINLENAVRGLYSAELTERFSI